MKFMIPMSYTANRIRARDGHDTSSSKLSSHTGLNPLSAMYKKPSLQSEICHLINNDGGESY